MNPDSVGTLINIICKVTYLILGTSIENQALPSIVAAAQAAISPSIMASVIVRLRPVRFA